MTHYLKRSTVGGSLFREDHTRVLPMCYHFPKYLSIYIYILIPVLKSIIKTFNKL